MANCGQEIGQKNKFAFSAVSRDGNNPDYSSSPALALRVYYLLLTLPLPPEGMVRIDRTVLLASLESQWLIKSGWTSHTAGLETGAVIFDL